MLRRAARSLAASPASCRLFCAAPQATDTLLLSGLVFYGRHGVLPAERTLGQKFVVDLQLSCNLRPAGQSDDVVDTICYATVHECVLRLGSAGAALRSPAFPCTEWCAKWWRASRASWSSRWRTRWHSRCSPAFRRRRRPPCVL